MSITYLEKIMSVEKIFPNGAYRITDMVGGRLFQRVYYGHTRREAVALFKQETRK